jgi:hypothetical protein
MPAESNLTNSPTVEEPRTPTPTICAADRVKELDGFLSELNRRATDHGVVITADELDEVESVARWVKGRPEVEVHPAVRQVLDDWDKSDERRAPTAEERAADEAAAEAFTQGFEDHKLDILRRVRASAGFRQLQGRILDIQRRGAVTTGPELLALDQTFADLLAPETARDESDERPVYSYISDILRDYPLFERTGRFADPDYLDATVGRAIINAAKVTPSRAPTLLTTLELLDRKDPTWLIEGVLPANVLGALHGAPDAGKTFLALDWALHVAAGLPWQGRAVTKGDALYVITEGEDWFKRRVASWCTAHRVAPADLAASFLLEPVNLLDEGAVTALLDAIGSRRLAFAVFDTLGRNMRGNENQTEDMSAVVAAADQVRRATGAMTQFVTHEPYSAPGRMRGSTVLPGAVRVAYGLVNDGTGRLTLTCTKGNDFQKPKPLALHLTSVDASAVIDADTSRNPAEEQAVYDALVETMAEDEWFKASGLASKVEFRKHVKALLKALAVGKNASGYYKLRVE